MCATSNTRIGCVQSLCTPLRSLPSFLVGCRGTRARCCHRTTATSELLPSMSSASEVVRMVGNGETSSPEVTLPDIGFPLALDTQLSDMRSTARSGKLSRRATFAPQLLESRSPSQLQPSAPEDPTTRRRQSILQQSSLLKQLSGVSIARQPSTPRRKSSILSTSQQPFARLQLSPSGKHSPTKPAHTQPSTPDTVRSSPSSQMAKTVKLEDVLDDYMVAVKKKAKPVEAAAGQHALDLNEAMQKLTVNWIVKTFVRHCSSFTV